MYNAIMEYGFNGTVLNCPMNDHQTAIFIAIRAQLDANKAKYEKAVEAGKKGARFGKRGGRPKKLQDSESLIESDFIEIELTESQE